MSCTWTATYMRHGTQYTHEFDTLRQAVWFAADGVETCGYAVERITGSGGEVIEDRELAEARLHYELGDQDHDRARVAKWGPRLADSPSP